MRTKSDERTRRRRGWVGPGRLVVELLRVAERQTDRVSKELGPRAAGWLRIALVVASVALAGSVVAAGCTGLWLAMDDGLRRAAVAVRALVPAEPPRPTSGDHGESSARPRATAWPTAVGRVPGSAAGHPARLESV